METPWHVGSVWPAMGRLCNRLMHRNTFLLPGKQFSEWAALLVCCSVALVLLSGAPAHAQTNTASGGGTWAGATWSLGHIPTITENVVINSGVNLTIGTAAVCANLTIGSATSSTTTLTVGAGGSLNVTGNLRLNPSNVNRAMTLAVGTQSATIAGTVTLSTTNTQTISVSSGSISFTRAAGITWSTDFLTLTGAGTITFSGLLTQSGGTIANNTTAGTFEFNGGYTKSGGTFTTRADEIIKFGGSLTVSNTALTLNATSLAQFEGSGTVTPTAAITFGNVQIDSGVTVTLAGNIAVAGNWTNNGGTLSGGTRTVTFSGANKTIGGSGSTAFPDVTIASGSVRSLDTGTTNSCSDLVFNAASTATALTHTGNASLSVGGNVTLNRPSTSGVTTTWNINAGTASVTGTTTITGTSISTTRIARIIVTSGTATFTGAVTFNIASSSAAIAEIRVDTGSITFSSALTMNEGTLAFSAAGTINFNSTYSFASGGSHTPVFTTVSGANINFGGALTVSATGGLTFNTGSNATFTGSGNITPTTNLALGNVTVNTGITATTVSDGGTFTIARNLVLSGTGTLAGTEPVLLTGSGVTLDGSGTLSAASTVSAAHTVLSTANLTISGIMTINNGITVTNNGTVTATDLGSGTGTWLQNAGTAWLNYSGSTITPTLTATASGNTVVYNAGGAQALKATNYYNLTLSNSGTKTFAAGTTGIAGNLSIGGTAVGNATANSTTINYNGSGAQAVGGISYYHLTLSNAGTKTFAAGTTGIAGNLSIGGSAVPDATTNSTTINYNGSGAQAVGAISYHHLTLSNAGTKTFAAGTTNIAGNLSIGGTAAGDATTNSTTINYNGSGAQAVGAIPYYNLTLSNAGTKTLAAGTTGIAATLTISGTAVADATTNSTTINYNGSGAQAVRAISYYHLTLSNAGTKTFAAGTTGIAGNLSISGTAVGNATANSTTINYNGSGAQAVGAISYYNLTLSNAGTKTFAASPITVQVDLTTSGTVTASCSSALTVNRNVSIGSGTTFNGGSGTLDFNGTLTVTNAAFTSTSGSLYLAGNLTFSSPTFSANSGTIIFDGSDSTLTPGGATFNNITVNKNSFNPYLSAGGSLTVSGAFDIQQGKVVMDPYGLSAGSLIVRAAGLIRNYGTGSLTLAGPVTNDGTIELNGGGDETCGSGSRILIRSSVPGTQRSWSGSGTFWMVDVDVRDQAGTADITCYGSQSSGNNGANWTIGSSCEGAPTAVNLISFTAEDAGEGTRIEWRTGYETGNIGFKVYRDTASGLQLITPSLVAGSALFAGMQTALTAGRTYVWWDRDKEARSSARYWLEDIDLDGTKTMHGPVVAGPARLRPQDSANSLMLAEVGRTSPPKIAANKPQVFSKSRSLSGFPSAAQVSGNQAQTTWIDIAAGPSVKLLVRQTGWYRVTGAQLLAAGISPEADPEKLKLFTDGIEVAILVTGGTSGRLDPNDSIGFYGIGNDTPWTDARTYWLVEGQTPGKRVLQTNPDITATIATGFTYSIEHKPRSIYVAALLNGDADNFFGPVISTSVTDDVFHVHDRDADSLVGGELTVTLQGISKTPHQVRVSLNNVALGVLTFDGQERGILKVSVPQSLLIEGDNVLRLVALGGEDDLSLIDTICLTYQHAFTADTDQQWLTLDAGISATLGGFTSSSIHVVDIGDPSDVHKLIAPPIPVGDLFSVPIGVLPGSATARLYAFTDSSVLTPAAVTPNTPSSWNSEITGADVILLTHASFKSAALALKSQHEAAGLSVALVDIEDIYDEFSFGEKTPAAIKEFVEHALSSWNITPKWLVLLGDASIDPRNYLGFGDLDLVPSRMVNTRYLETASDDWFADIDNDGIPELAVGRLPVRTVSEADALVNKLDAYRKQSRNDWMKNILLVADKDDAGAFEGASEAIRTDLGSQWPSQTVYRDELDVPSARAALFAAIDAGVGVVNYLGHGSVDLWQNNLLTNNDAAALTNGSMLPVVLSMTCLNGFFADVYTESLAEALLNAANGGAAAVWASSGLTESSAQVPMNREIYRMLQRRGITLGQAAVLAKRAVNDLDIRRTWILFGDPTLPSPLAETGPPDTNPLVITDISVSSITQTSAVITWSTDDASDSKVEYGISDSYGTATPLDAAQVTLHSQELTDLSAGTVYHYRVKSTTMDGDSAVSDDYTFTTEELKDTTPPIILGITLNDISENTVDLRWVTDEPADAQVEFGKTQPYDRTTTLNEALSTMQRVALTDLDPDTMYYYCIKSRDASGNLATSEGTFTTLPAPDTTPPLISDIGVHGITSTSVTITWITSEPADAQVLFGRTYFYDDRTSIHPTLEFEHGQTITGLSPNTTYHFRVRSRDASGNLSVSNDQTFATPALPLDRSHGTSQRPMKRTLRAPVTMAIPITQSVEDWHAGVVIVNPENAVADLSFTFYSNSGKPIQAPGFNNPVSRTLGPGEQLSVVDTQLFGSALFENQEPGWILIQSSVPGIAALFSIFSDSLPGFELMNLSGTPTTAAILPEIETEGYTNLSIANPAANPTPLTISLMKQDGTIRASEMRILPALSVAEFNIQSDLFPQTSPGKTDYVRVSSDEDVNSLEIFGKSCCMAGLGGQDADKGAAILYSTQYVIGGSYHSTVSIINLESKPGAVTLRFFGEDAIQLGGSRTIPIEGYGKISIDDADFFGKPPEEEMLQGYLEIQSDGIRLTGSVVLSDSGRGKFSAALPLAAELHNTMLFGYVASDPEDFTGLAILNPQTGEVVATIDLHAADGTIVASTTERIPAKQRRSRLLTKIFPTLSTQNLRSGYIRLSADKPVAAHVMVGKHNLSAVSPVPPQDEK
jgi:hypothetical protein